MSRANPRFHRSNPSLPVVGASNGVVEYIIQGALEGQLTISTFYYSSAVPAPTQAQLSTLLTNISTAVFGGYLACVSADWSCTLERLNVVHVNNIMGVTSLNHAGSVGGRSAGHEPTEVGQPLIRYSAVKGQHGRGRVTLPAIATSDVTGSKITAAAEITNITTLRGDMLATVSDGANTWTPCVAQRATSTPKLVVGFSPITTVAMSPLLGTVRRRKIGRGK